ncbi:MAG: RNA polymerase sigma factor [Bacillota bacterium]
MFRKFSGDTEVVRVLFELFAQRVFEAAYYILGDRSSAEDVVQDTFLAAIEHLDQLNNPEKVEGWLLQVATNKAYDEYSKRQKLVSLSNKPGDNCTCLDFLAIANRLVVTKAIDSLPVEHQMVIFLKYYRDLTIKQIAAILKIPEGTVKTRLQKARGLVANLLGSPVEGAQ